MPVTEASTPITSRWTKLRNVKEQKFLWRSRYRFKVVPAGRRSGKTELAKRRIVLAALAPPGSPWASTFDDPRYAVAAPTYAQAKRIYWEDLKKMIPRKLIKDISESALTITTVLNSSITVVGLDKPERIEGTPWDGVIVDEYGNVKASAWPQNIRPALSDRMGWAWLIGVPEGRNHYYTTAEDAKARQLAGEQEWGFFTWPSRLVLPASEIEAAMRDLDELTFKQEYEASFVNFKGRAYHAYGDHNLRKLDHDPKAPIYFCFDFNVDPGVAGVCQKMTFDNRPGLGAIGEVHIPLNSNTEAVCRKLIADWGTHQGIVYIQGDATGGARGTAQTQGSDWDIINTMLRDHFGTRVISLVPTHNPTERARVNAVNSLCRSAAGHIRFYVDPARAPMLHRDFDGVRLLEGGSGEIDKKKDPALTHLSDAVGYLIVSEFPIDTTPTVATVRIRG